MKALLATLVTASLALNGLFLYQTWAREPSVRTAHSAADLVVMRTPGGLLEVSSVTAEERFDSTTTHTVLGVELGKTVAQIRVPSVYRYHIPLAGEWTFRVIGDAVVVMAPKVQPTLPVAIDTGKLESFSSGLWSPITGADAIAGLQKSITAQLALKAGSQQMNYLQREAARTTVSEFVQKWVVEQPRWKGLKQPAILVFFEDEPLGKKAVPLMSPSA